MCGIIGILGKEDVADDLLSTLQHLEYRGYDSAGIAIQQDGHIQRLRAAGKLMALTRRVVSTPLQGTQGIGHTRWATHGAPTESNAHPHCSGPVYLVHNGIIENYQMLKRDLAGSAISCETETDTEVVCALIHKELKADRDDREAFFTTLRSLKGAFALVVMIEGEENRLYFARSGSPLAIAQDGKGSAFVGSDAIALSAFANRISYLDDGDWGWVERGNHYIFNAKGEAVERPLTVIDQNYAQVDKGNYPHFMLKEIYEQPEVIARTLAPFIGGGERLAHIPAIDAINWKTLPLLHLVSCGTAFYSGLVFRHWLEALSGLPVLAEVASEYRYGSTPLFAGGVTLLISQSGETADTYASLSHAKEKGETTISVVNVPTSSIARDSDIVLPTSAGVEVSVASSKAFVCQLATLAALALMIARARGRLDKSEETLFLSELAAMPSSLSAVLALDTEIQALARRIHTSRSVFFLGRGQGYHLAQEGALKLKELSYIQAEAYPSGELKHGPIALIDEKIPSIIIAPTDQYFDKLISNLKEIKARGGSVYLLTDKEGAQKIGDEVDGLIIMPDKQHYVWPLCYALPLQLLAYHTARLLGTDIDQPRNLAKSVTVE